jgi:hypothetical protein
MSRLSVAATTRVVEFVERAERARDDDQPATGG